MITIFSTPRDFIGEYDIIQKNALSSWRALSNNIEIIILGDSKGSKEAAELINAVYIPDVPNSNYGLPTIRGLFETAERNGHNQIYCYLNSDIILPPNFLKSIQHISNNLKHFLAVGFRFNMDVKSIIDFSSNSKYKLFFEKSKDNIVKDNSSAIDMFCFTKGVFKNIPNFSVGRPGFDNWLLWKARRTFTPVIDISSDIKVIHQNHTYNFKGLKTHQDVLNTEEAKMNYKLMDKKGLSLNDTNWILDNGKLKKKKDYAFKQRNLGKLPIIYPEFAFFLIWYKRLFRRFSKLFK